MKRIISICLIMCLFGLYNSFVFADTLDDEWLAGDVGYKATNDDIDYTPEIQLLQEIGLLSGYENGDFVSAGTISKGEFLNLIMNIVSNTPQASAIVSPFSDVKLGDKYYDSIISAYQLGLIDRSTDGLFESDSDLTLYGAVKILVNLLGYRLMAINEGGYPFGYMSEAVKIGLFKQINTSKIDVFSRGAAAKLLLNACNVDMMQQTSFSDQSNYKVIEGQTFLYKYKKINRKKGIVTATDASSLTEVDGVGKNHIKIDNTIYLCGDKDYQDTLGYYVEFYATEDEPTVLATRIINNRNKVTSVFDSEIDGITNRELSYSQKNSENIQQIKIPSGIIVIHNGKSMPIYTLDIFDIKSGKIDFIDNNSDGNWDIANITEYVNYAVFLVNKKDKTISDRYDGTKQLDLSDENIYLKITDLDNNPMKFENIKEWDILSVAMSDDKKYIRIYVSSEVVDGATTEISHQDDDLFVKIDGIEYEVAYDSKATVSGLDLGVQATFHMDNRNRIAGVSRISNAKKYGYLIEATNLPIRIDNTIKFKILTDESKVVIYKAADKFYIDNELQKNITDVPTKLKKPIMIRYQLNSKGDITSFDTSKLWGSGELNSFSSFGSLQKLAYFKLTDPAKSGTFGGKFLVDSSTKIFLCSDAATPYDESNFSIIDYNFFLVNYSYNAQGFTTNSENPVAEVALVYSTGLSDINRYSDCGLISKISTVIDNDIIVTKLYINAVSGEKKLVVKDAEILKKNNFKVGDMIKYTTSNNIITNSITIFRAADRSMTSESIIPTTVFGDVFRVLDGYIYTKLGNYVGMSTSNAPDQDVAGIEFFPLPANIYVVSKEKVVRGKAEDVKDCIHNLTTDKAFIFFKYAIPQMVVVYEQ